MVHLRFFKSFDSRSGGPPPPPAPPEPPGSARAGHSSLPPFHEILLDGIGSVHFSQGPEYAATIDGAPSHTFNVTIGEPAEFPIGATVRDGVLRLESGISKGRIVIRSNPPVFRVTGPHLERITIKGAARARVTGLHDDSLSVSVDGAGDIQMSDLTLRRLHVRIGGAGKLDARGSAFEQEIEITGAGSFTGDGLTGSNGLVTINGAGKAKVHVSERLQIAIGGVGTVVYLGNPAVEQRVGGLGRVRRA